ncbi:MAG: bifunctional diguanylate cyclase/phosphodiesterase [Lachnospiraceae bacterium]|nr:bifunctional diguanylate cyclase/phosphodiesterase [Lachnospiraceae bacterium]
MRDRYRRIREIDKRIKEIDKRFLLVSILVIVLLVSSWIIFALHLDDISKKYEILINERVAADVRNDSIVLSGGISKSAVYIGNLGEMLSNQDSIERDEIKKALRTAKEKTNFIDVFYSDVDGRNAFNYMNKVVSGNLKPYINNYDGISDFGIFNNVSAIATDKDGYIAIAPVKKNNSILGYVYGVNTYDNLEENTALSRSVDEDILIIANDGRIVFRIRNGEYSQLNEDVYFFNYVSDYISQDEYSEFVDDYNMSLSTGISSSYFASSGEEKILYMYTPIDNISGWSVMHCINEKGITKIVKSMLVSSIIMFFIIIVLLFIATFIVITHIRNEQKRAENLEYLDGLTGVMNRNAFSTKASEIIEDNPGLPYRIVCLDILNFRIINENYGHERADVIIKALADACKEAFGKNEVFGRVSADVFVALAVNDGEEVERIAFLEDKVSEAAKSVYINHQIKIKMGIYEIDDVREPIARMIDKANVARKDIGSSSKLLVCTYTDELMDGAKKIQLIESQMEAALTNGEFKPFLQAKYDMEKNHVCGAETLVRWIKPDGTMMPPGDFIPLFEKNGFVEKIDFYMLEEVCKYIRKMLDENKEVYPISVNQSRYLLNDPDYVSKVKEILLKYKIPVGLIELELTETVFFHEKERMVAMMNELKYINVNLSIDDFGSGYSSFSMLKDVPFDVLKIDRAFLVDSVSLEKGRWILKEIIEMAKGLGMDVICEGVETQEQAEMLVSLGCKKAQGFLYARPIPMDDFIEKYNVSKAG